MISRRSVLQLGTFGGVAALFVGRAVAAERVRVGALKFGTVNWELDTIKHHKLDTANGVDVAVTYFAGEAAADVGILARAIDVILSDWLWVSRRRTEGSDVTLFPYSTAIGAVMVKRDSPIKGLADLRGRKIGIAGGPTDKSWLLIQALARRDYDLDLARANEIVFGAPPLISEKVDQGELDAALNFWHYCARLEAKGFRRVIGAGEAAIALGASGPVSAIGYVFHEKWANENPIAVSGFLAASAAAKDVLARSDEEWLRLAPIIRAEGKELEALRDRYRMGIPRRSVAEEEVDAARLYRILAEIGGERIVGKAKEMAPGTFWSVRRR